MDLTALVQNGIAGGVAEMAIAALWQGALIASALWICLRLAPRVSAGYRFAAWSAAFVVLVCLSLCPLVPHFSFGTTHVAVQAPQNVAGPILDLDARWSLAIVGLWLLLALIRAADLAIHSLRLRGLWNEATPVTLDERVAAVLGTATAQCGRGPVEVCTTETLQRPSVIGFNRPRILIPDWLYARLTHGELEQIVLHEVEHLRRRDDWTNLIQKFCLVMFPLNPALAWIERRLCREREMACDEGVIRVTRAPRAYAACLASLAERGLERRVEALSLGAWQRRPELVHRVHSILRCKASLSPVSARLLMGTLGCGLIAGSVELAQTPQLVAFVSESSPVMAKAQNPAAINSASALAISAKEPAIVKEREPGDSGGQFAAVNTSLRVPVASPVRDSRTSRVSGALKAVPVVAQSQAHAPRMAQDQEWVVLTAWTQVEPTNAAAGVRVRADYEIEEASGIGSDPRTTAQQDKPVNHITITQLIFRVQPAAGDSGNAASNSATSNGGASEKSGQSASPATNPSTIQPKIAAIRDGWLILQL